MNLPTIARFSKVRRGHPRQVSLSPSQTPQWATTGNPSRKLKTRPNRQRRYLHQDLIAFTRFSEISLMCSKPSVPGKISTNAPKSTSRTTLPRYVLPISGKLEGHVGVMIAGDVGEVGVGLSFLVRRRR